MRNIYSVAYVCAGPVPFFGKACSRSNIWVAAVHGAMTRLAMTRLATTQPEYDGPSEAEPLLPADSRQGTTSPLPARPARSNRLSWLTSCLRDRSAHTQTSGPESNAEHTSEFTALLLDRLKEKKRCAFPWPGFTVPACFLFF